MHALKLEYSAREGNKRQSHENLTHLEHEMKLVYDFMTDFVH